MLGTIGRIGRLNYFVEKNVIRLLFLFLFALLIRGFQAKVVSASLAPWLALLITVLELWSEANLIVKRLHDLDRPAWHSLFLFIPLYNIYFALVLVFTRGTTGANRFGEDPFEKDLDPIETLLSTACQNEINGDWEKAVEIYNDIIMRFPDSPESAYADNCRKALQEKVAVASRIAT